MTEPTVTKNRGPGRPRSLGDDPVQVSLRLPVPVYEAIAKLAAAEYETVPGMVRRLLVSGLRAEGVIE